MRKLYRAIAVTFAAGICLAVSVPAAFAGCGIGHPQGPFVYVGEGANLLAAKSTAHAVTADNLGGSAAPSLVGMWSTQLVSKGNLTAATPIPDGVLIDFGYQIFHSDNTEWENSGGRSPSTQNYCEGVWGQTGFNTYELNHFAYQYDATTGNLTGTANIKYQLTLSPSGDSFTGTFTIDVYDTKANPLDHLTGTLSATRVTVDTGVTAIP